MNFEVILETSRAPSGWTNRPYTYGSTAHVHAVTSVARGGGATETYTYDTNGNTLAPAASAGMTCRREEGN